MNQNAIQVVCLKKCKYCLMIISFYQLFRYLCIKFTSQMFEMQKLYSTHFTTTTTMTPWGVM